MGGRGYRQPIAQGGRQVSAHQDVSADDVR